MICALKAAVGWVVLLFLGTNLVGFLVRGLVQQAHMDEAAKRLADAYANAIPDEKKRQVALAGPRTDVLVNQGVNVAAGLACLAYLGILYYLWNWLVALVGLMLLFSRTPDLLHELRTGQKVASGNMPSTPIHVAATTMMWLAIPLLWWGLCRM
jgi:hypothetical protein